MLTQYRRFVTAAVLACALSPLVADPRMPGRIATAADAEVKPLAAGDIDPVASRVYVRVGKRRLGHEHGVEGRVKSGHLDLDATQDAGEIVFDMQSFKADTDAARKHVGLEGATDADEQADVTKTMTGKSVLDVKQFPTATFTVTSATRAAEKSAGGDPLYNLVGEFSLHGKEQPLTVVAAITEERDGWQRLSGEFSIKQTDYGIKPYSAVGGLVAVTDELRIFGELWMVK